jgi:hypothetical protein
MIGRNRATFRRSFALVVSLTCTLAAGGCYRKTLGNTPGSPYPPPRTMSHPRPHP